MEKTNAWMKYPEGEKRTQVFDFAEDYRKFLSACKTERECTSFFEAKAKEAGYQLLEDAIKEKKSLKPGDKVYCSDMTFDATVNPVVYEGGVPVFIDTEYHTWNMDPVALEKAFELYPDVKVVVVAHLYGTPGKIDAIRKVCSDHGAVIIEDAAESLGAIYKGQETGTFGTYNCISFNGNNVLETEVGEMGL